MARTGCGCNSELARSASSIVADTARGYHILKIDGYSLSMGTPTGEYLKSHSFTVGGHQWKIRYYPNGSTSEAADFISIFLQHDGSVANLVKARYQFRLIDNVGEEPVTLEAVTSFASNSGWGYQRFIKREKLEKSKHLKDDSFTVRCDILVVNEFRTKVDETVVESPPRFVSMPPSDLHQDLGNLLQSEKGADVVFDVAGQTFAAHRCVLAARSPVFSAELLGTMKESSTTGVVRVDDMEAQVFKALLNFVYTDSLPKTEETEQATQGEGEDDIMSQHLLVAADRYNLERLKLICEEKLCRYIDVGTVATILTLAEQHSCHGLKKACLHFLSVPANLRAAMATDDFKHLSRSCPAVMEECAELLGAMKESRTLTNVVRVDNMEAPVFRALLCFLYTDSLPEMRKEDEDVMYQHLLVAGDRYGMGRLKLVCEEKLCEYIDVGSAATILTLAEQHHCHGLKKACFSFLSDPANLRAAMASDGF